MIKSSPLDPEKGAIVVIREANSRRRHLWPALCALAVLALLAVTSYLVLSQIRQNGSDSQLQLEDATSADNALPHLMKQIGDDPRGRIAAHLVASTNRPGKELIWEKTVLPSNVVGMDFVNNGLVIETRGFYFVYTQVVFYGKDCPDHAIYLSHNITSRAKGSQDTNLLLKAMKSACHFRQHQQLWYKTSYQGGVFEFDVGDQVYSMVNEWMLNYVDNSSGKTFFGMFAL
ncbi:tumor necrosis factor-like [Leucoraja erinacea]|uniref:tumor necrosis factor-like n=1 Tax=Leucoraja erinaceus TaxID=7782 RepID=UPI002456E2FF|nr:tumor necrosis factor-like [Leucoraja erinacea]